MNNTPKYFKLFSSCVPVLGASRAIIYDLQRATFEYISIGLFELLQDCDKLSINEIYDKYNYVIIDIIDEYFNWLILKEFGFYTIEPQNFPKLNLQFERPEVINNAIIDVDISSDHSYSLIFDSLNSLSCKFIELRFFYSPTMDELDRLFENVQKKCFRNVDIICKYNEEYSFEIIERFTAKFPVITKMTFFDSPRKEVIRTIPSRIIVFTTQIIYSENCCGKINFANFSVNTETFLESQKFNSCLNKKISVDKFGIIRNCPSLTKSFGHIGSVKLDDVANSIEFQEIWNISKDQIDVCKVCEFRYMCTDCRAYLGKDLVTGKPFKCKYNPYTTTWEK